MFYALSYLPYYENALAYALKPYPLIAHERTPAASLLKRTLDRADCCLDVETRDAQARAKPTTQRAPPLDQAESVLSARWGVGDLPGPILEPRPPSPLYLKPWYGFLGPEPSALQPSTLQPLETLTSDIQYYSCSMAASRVPWRVRTATNLLTA